MFDLEQFTLGPVETNTYLINHRWIIDPAGTNSELSNALDAVDRLNGVLLTHAHYDHIAGLGAIQERYDNVPVYCHERDQAMLGDAEKNMSTWTGNPQQFSASGCVTTLKDQGFEDEPDVLEIPGHTAGSVGFYWPADEVLVSGDALFHQGIGRTDLPGGDHGQLLRSIRQEIFSLPDDTVVYPGHGPRTTVGQERRSNPHLQ